LIDEEKVKIFHKTLRDFSIKSKLLTLTYLAYLTIPIITLILFEDVFNQLIMTSSNQQIESGIIDKVVEYYTIYTSSYATVLLIVALGLILLTKTTSKLIHIITEKKPFIHITIMLVSSLILLITSISMYLSLPQLARNFTNELTNLLSEGNLEEARISIPATLRALTLLSEISLRLAILTHGIKLYQLIEENELLSFMKSGAILVIVGSILSIIEVFYIGIGLGSLLILGGLYKTSVEKK